jgi:hypothetical protein
MAGKFGSIRADDRLSVSDEKNILFPYGRVGQTGFSQEHIDKILSTSRHGTNALSIDELLSLTGFENEGVLKAATAMMFATKGGDLSHMVAQAQTPEDFEEIERLVTFLTQMSNALENTGAMFDSNVAQHIGESFNDLISKYGEKIGDEIIIGGVTPEGRAINGRMDQLMYGQRNGRNAFTIVDYKTHKDGKITAEDIYQTAQYQDML